MQERQVTTQLYGLRSQTGKCSVRAIFEDNHNWDVYAFQHKDELRPVEIKEVQKMMTCKDLSRGFFTMYCENCKETHDVYFGCNSRICSNCGKNYTDKWAKSLRNAMFDVVHRHVVLSVPDMLWQVIKEYRGLQKVLMDCAIRTINKVLSYYNRCKLTAGAIVVLHPFSRALEYKPHLHILLTEGGFDRTNKFVPVKHIPFGAMRKIWQYEVLTNFKKHLPKTKSFSQLIDHLFRKYTDGFYAHLPIESRITNLRQVGKYIGRYVRHPAIANTRIIDYDGKQVTFWYRDNQKLKHYVTMEVQEFIGAIIQHIPDPHFKMIRYYGAYTRKIKKRYSHYLIQRSISQAVLGDFPKKKAIRCPDCGSIMELIKYNKKGPPDKPYFGYTLVDWNYILPEQTLA